MDVRFTLLVWYSSLCILAARGEFIEFANESDISAFPNRVAVFSQGLVTWSAVWPTDVRFEFYGAHDISMSLECRSAPLSGEDELTQGSFCVNYVQPYLHKCWNLSPGNERRNFTIGGMTIESQFSANLGMTARIQEVPPGKQQLPLFATCRLQNRRGSATSNRMFVVDLRQKFPIAVETISEAASIEMEEASSIPCVSGGFNFDAFLNLTYGPYQQPTVPKPFEWFVCDSSELEECPKEALTSVFGLAPFKQWPVQILGDGDLYFPFLPTAVKNQIQNKFLVCTFNSEPVSFYSEPLNITVTEEDMSEESEKIEDPKPRNSNQSLLPNLYRSVLLYNSPGFNLELPCLIRHKIHISRIRWFFTYENTNYTIPLEQETKKAGVSVAKDSSSISFEGPFSDDIRGTYQCQVTYGNRSHFNTSYFVRVSGPPRIASSVPRELVVIEGGRTEFECAFEGSSPVTPSLEVCGHLVNSDDVLSIEESRKRINMKFKAVLTPLKFEISKGGQGRSLIYRTGRLASENSSHQVTCVGENPPFAVRKTVTIRVMPLPELVSGFPDKVCRGHCNLTCSVPARSYYESRNHKVDVRWSVQNSVDNKAFFSLWSSWEATGPHYQLKSDGGWRRRRVRCQVRLLSPVTRRVIFAAESTSGDVQMATDSDDASSSVLGANYVPTVVASSAFGVVVVVSVIYFAVYRWKHRMRQSA